jgi:hypothetical protein
MQFNIEFIIGWKGAFAGVSSNNFYLGGDLENVKDNILFLN